MKVKSHELSLAALFSAFTLIGGFISIPIGPVPITLQTLFVLLTGFYLSPMSALMSQGVHLLLVLIMRGPQAFLSPSFGFLVAFPAAAYLSSYLKENKIIINSFLLVTIATVVLYLIGTPYMGFILNYILDKNFSLIQIIKSGVLLFIPGDLMKGAAALAVVNRLKKVSKVPL